MSEVKTAEQIAAETAAAKAAAKAQADAAKAEAKAKTDAAKAEAKAKTEAAKAELKAKKEADALAVKEAKEAALAAKAKEKAEAAAKAAEAKTKVVLPSQNGVTRPKPEGACGKVWAMADLISARLGQPVAISTLIKETAAAGLNDATTRTQYARWKQFNGVFGQVAKPAEPAPAANADGAAQAA